MISDTTNIPSRVAATLKRAFGEFLTVPLAVVIGFVLITVVVYGADTAWSKSDVPSGFSWLGQLLGDSKSLATLLATIASSIITVTSITFSLLLIALQQGASALTTQVTDQFLMRRSNQFYFGYFVGLSVFALLSLVTASDIHRPVFGASIIVVLTIIALCMVVVMIYDTIDQMRPTQIVRAIHHHILKARPREAALLTATRRTPRTDWPIVGTIRAGETGHVASIDVDRMRAALADTSQGDVEVELRVPIGRFTAFGDPLVTVRSRTAGLSAGRLEAIEAVVLGAIGFNDARNLRGDPSFGISQLTVIAWTSITTAKSNPAPGEAVIHSLRDILSRWAHDGGEVAGDPASLIVVGDAAPGEAIDALEHIILATSESMQAHCLAKALRTVSILLETAPAAWRDRLAEVARRALSSLGEHVLTTELEAALVDLATALTANGHAEIGASVHRSTTTLATTLGELNSRSTRVPGAA